MQLDRRRTSTPTRCAPPASSGPPEPGCRGSRAARRRSRRSPGARPGARPSLDLDCRAACCGAILRRRRASAMRAAVARATVAVGNREEAGVAVGDGRAAARWRERLLALGTAARDRQARAARACSRRARRGALDRRRRCRSRSSTGSAPATRSAARCATGCSRAGRSSGSSATRTPPARSWRRGLGCADDMPTAADVEALLCSALAKARGRRGARRAGRAA